MFLQVTERGLAARLPWCGLNLSRPAKLSRKVETVEAPQGTCSRATGNACAGWNPTSDTAQPAPIGRAKQQRQQIGGHGDRDTGAEKSRAAKVPAPLTGRMKPKRATNCSTVMPHVRRRRRRPFLLALPGRGASHGPAGNDVSVALRFATGLTPRQTSAGHA